MPNISRFLFVLFCVGLLAACGALPKPFAHDGPVKSNPLILLAGGEAIKVEIDPSLPEFLAKPLSENMIKALWAEQVLASAATNFRPRYILSGQLKITYPSLNAPEVVEIIWTLSDAKGINLKTFDQRMSGDRAGWMFLDSELLVDLSSDMGKEIVGTLYGQAIPNRRALFIPPAESQKGGASTPALKPPGTSDSAVLLKKPKIFLAEVIGAPGDGNKSLHKNLLRLLKKSGAEMVTERPISAFLVKGFVNVSPPYGGTNDVAITWLVATKDGKELGKITQNNKVPIGALNGRWGDIAHVIAQGASIGIIDVVEQKLRPVTGKKLLIIR